MYVLNPYFAGTLSLILIYLLFSIISWSFSKPAVPRARFSSWNTVNLFRGIDGRLSTSKFQFFVWTVVIIFSYIAVYTAIYERKRILGQIVNTLSWKAPPDLAEQLRKSV